MEWLRKKRKDGEPNNLNDDERIRYEDRELKDKRSRSSQLKRYNHFEHEDQKLEIRRDRARKSNRLKK